MLPARLLRAWKAAAEARTHVAISRNALTWWAVSIGIRKLPGEDDRGRRGKAGTGLRAEERHGRDGPAVRAAREARRPLLLPEGRHARLHGAGVRDPRRL